MSRPLIILDRDGVINADSPDYIRTPEEWVALPGSVEAIARLSQAGWRVAVASNQSGVGRGFYSIETMHAINQKMLDAVEAVGGRIDRVVCCPHHPEESCSCRKPAPGMILELLSDADQPPSNVPVVGDSLRDIQAAFAADARPMLVLTGNGRKTLGGFREQTAVPVFADLSACVDHILESQE